MLLGAVGEHGPDFSVAADGALKDDVTSVRGPGGVVVASGFVGNLKPALAGDVHDVDILTAGVARPVLAVPTEGDELAVGSPGGRDSIAAVCQALDVGAVLIHDVDLRLPGAPADPGQLRVGVRIPGGREVGTTEVGEPAQIGAARVGDPDFWIAGARGGESDPGAVGGPCRAKVTAACRAAGEGYRAVEFQGVHADGPSLAAKGRERKPRVIRRDARRERNAAQVGDGVLVLPVVVHGPDLFGAGAGADEVDFG